MMASNASAPCQYDCCRSNCIMRFSTFSNLMSPFLSSVKTCSRSTSILTNRSDRLLTGGFDGGVCVMANVSSFLKCATYNLQCAFGGLINWCVGSPRTHSKIWYTNKWIPSKYMNLTCTYRVMCFIVGIP